MILTIVGARPQFIKAAMVSKAFKNINLEEKIIHTGQHYDENMSEVFWEELGIPKTFANLNIGSGLHGEQTARMIIEIEKHILKLKPKYILLYGDTNSTLAGAIAASKLNTKIIHVEAGVRSFNRTMPEEVNRILTDKISSVLFCSSESGVEQLKSEGLVDHVYNVGDVMYDAVKLFSNLHSLEDKIDQILPFDDRNFALATIHRPSNTDEKNNFQNILDAFGKLHFNIVFPLHPRIKEKIHSFFIPENVFIIPPVSYIEMQGLLHYCSKVFTDSGGLQKEAYWHRKQCITIRDETEWIETIHDNWNSLTGPDGSKIRVASEKMPLKESWYPLYGDGAAAEKIASILNNLEFPN